MRLYSYFAASYCCLLVGAVLTSASGRSIEEATSSTAAAESLQHSVIQQTRQLVQSVAGSTANNKHSPLSLARGLLAADDSAFTTVLADGTTVVSIQPICQALQANFVHNVTCICTGSSVTTFAIHCDYDEPICTPSRSSCGTPRLALSIVNFEAFSATACIYNYTRKTVNMPDTCVSLQVCPPDQPGGIMEFCGCLAEVNGQLCSECNVCRDEQGSVFDSSPTSVAKTGIFMNCTNQNAEFITDSCDVIDLDLDVSGMSAAMR